MLIVGHAGYLDRIHSYARFPSIHCPHRVAEAGADPGETGLTRDNHPHLIPHLHPTLRMTAESGN